MTKLTNLTKLPKLTKLTKLAKLAKLTKLNKLAKLTKLPKLTKSIKMLKPTKLTVKVLRLGQHWIRPVEQKFYIALDSHHIFNFKKVGLDKSVFFTVVDKSVGF